jgi:hypothetical protein
VLSSDFRTLVDALGGPPVVDVGQDLPALVRWSSRTLDTRMGAERQAAAPITFPDPKVAALLTAAGPLGLLRTQTPTLPRYDMTVVLGGTTTGNELRTKLAAEFASKGMVLGQVVGLAADRAITPGERDASGHRTEAGHLDSLLTVALGREHPEPWNEVHALQSIDPAKSQHRGSGTRTLTAPSSRPGRRADTEDAILFLAHEVLPAWRRRVLVITSAIYAPYQFLVVAPPLIERRSRHVELVGTPTATDGPPESLAQRVAQEIHATVVTLARHLGRARG